MANNIVIRNASQKHNGISSQTCQNSCKRPQITNVGEGVGKWKPHVSQNVSLCSKWKAVWSFLKKLHRAAIRSNNIHVSNAQNISKENKNTNSYRYLRLNGHSITVYNTKIQKQLKYPLSEWIKKTNTHKLSHKKKEIMPPQEHGWIQRALC